MGALADAARTAGGKVTGITPQLLVDQGIADLHCDELVVTESMRERKALLEERADGFVTLPGGIGTFEEVFEIIVGRVLGYHSKPIVLLNVADYYAPLLAMIEHGIETRFIRPATRDAYFVAGTVPEAIAFLNRAGNADLKDMHRRRSGLNFLSQAGEASSLALPGRTGGREIMGRTRTIFIALAARWCCTYWGWGCTRTLAR